MQKFPNIERSSRNTVYFSSDRGSKLSDIYTWSLCFFKSSWLDGA